MYITISVIISVLSVYSHVLAIYRSLADFLTPGGDLTNVKLTVLPSVPGKPFCLIFVCGDKTPRAVMTQWLGHWAVMQWCGVVWCAPLVLAQPDFTMN